MSGVKTVRILISGAALCLGAAQASLGAGFALYEGSARGNALGSAMTGKADDPSAIYYNPAGIANITNPSAMAGATIIAPSTKVKTRTPAGTVTTKSEDNVWVPPHIYATYPLKDRIVAGVGLYSRFGLGTEFDENWPGRYNSYDAEIKTLTLNPNLGLKLTDELTAAAGVSAMWFDLKLQRKLPYLAGQDLNFKLKGDSYGYGYNFGLRYAPFEWVDLGAAYQSQIRQNISGTADIQVRSTDADGSVTLPDMIFLGANFKPVKRVNFEVGGVYTRWSSYDSLQVNYQDPTVLGVKSTESKKDWHDVWRYQTGLEYWATEQLALRVGFIYDDTPDPGRTTDYMVPANDRRIYNIGAGYTVKQFTLDLSYSYIDILGRHIDARPEEGVYDSEFTDGHAHLFGISLSAKL